MQRTLLHCTYVNASFHCSRSSHFISHFPCCSHLTVTLLFPFTNISLLFDTILLSLPFWLFSYLSLSFKGYDCDESSHPRRSAHTGIYWTIIRTSLSSLSITTVFIIVYRYEKLDCYLIQILLNLISLFHYVFNLYMKWIYLSSFSFSPH